MKEKNSPKHWPWVYWLLLLLTLGTIFILFAWVSSVNLETKHSLQNTPQTNNNAYMTTSNQQQIFPEANTAPYLYVSREWVDVNEQWQMRMLSVKKDERCPYLVACETNGVAEVEVEFQRSDVDFYKPYIEVVTVAGLNRSPMPDGAVKENFLKPLRVSGSSPDGTDIGFTLTPIDLRPYPDKTFFEDVSQQQYQLLVRIAS